MNRIGRRGFIGGAAAGVGAAAVGMAGRSHAIGGDEPWENRLYPTGNSAIDYPALEKAIKDGGAFKLMKGRRGEYFNLIKGNENDDGYPYVTREKYPPIEIPHDVAITGQGTIIACNNTVFTCKSKVQLTIRNVHFSMIDREEPSNLPSPIDIMKPANHANVTLNLIKVSMGNDDPWD